MIGTWLMYLDLVRFIPVMMTRTILSLKKATNLRELHLSLEDPSELPMHLQDGHSPRRVAGIQLSLFKSGRRQEPAGRSHADESFAEANPSLSQLGRLNLKAEALVDELGNTRPVYGARPFIYVLC